MSKLNAKARCCFAILIILGSIFWLNNPIKAQNKEPTLVDTINNILSHTNLTTSPQSIIYGQIFGLENISIYDQAINQAFSQQNYPRVILIKRLAEINNYNSATINNCVRETLENMPKCGSLPAINAGGFFIPNSYMLYCYRYAEQLGVPGWNLTQGFQQFAHAYLNKPFNSLYGEMLWIGPAPNSSASFLSRYYDEQAGTLSCFLTFALLGEKNSMQYADDVWLNIQDAVWNGAFYGYIPQAENRTECEMGNFAQIIAHYQNSRGALPYFDRVLSDLQNKLLTDQYNSPGWGTVGVLKHADPNPQLRLQETLSAVATLQMLYPEFNQTWQNNFNQMIAGNCWRGVIRSSLFSNYQFREVSDGCYTNDATLQGCMLLFLDGIAPNTASVMVTPDNEIYQDSLTNFPTSQWSFNYHNQTIKIPVTKGNLSFIFGSQQVNATFPSDGVYTVKFRSNWNQIQSISKVANTTAPALQPAKIIKLDRSAALNASALIPQEPGTTLSTKPLETASISSGKSLRNVPLLLMVPVILTVVITIYFLKRRKPAKIPCTNLHNEPKND